MTWRLIFLYGLAASLSAQALEGPLLTNDRWPRATTLEEWTADVMRIEGLEEASETAQGKAFFRWLRLFNRMATGGMIQAYEGPHGDEQFVLDLHKTLFVYGWGYCDTSSRIAEAAWTRYKGDMGSAQRVITQHEDGGYHTMYRLRLDGNWGAFDPRYGYYLVDRDAPDARILDWAEVGVDENIRKNKTYDHRSGPFFEHFGREWDRAFLINECFYESEEAWVAAGRPVECVFANPQHDPATRYHDMDFRLLPGMTIERFWDNSARKFYTPLSKRSQREEPFLPAGRFYRVTESMFDGNWPKHDPNYEKAKPYLVRVPADEGYNAEVRGGLTLGQAWGRIVYEPDLASSDGAAALTPDSTMRAAAPFLHATAGAGAQSATLDLYSPYVLVDGAVRGALAGNARLEIRTLQAKARNVAMPDVWSTWRTLAAKPGAFDIALTKDGPDRGLHGVYRFQLRVVAETPAGATAPSGLESLRLTASFETGIMSIPQLFSGRNTVRFRLNEGAPRTPIRVRYDYQTAEGERTAKLIFEPAELKNGEAVRVIDTPGLIRCNAVSIEY